MENNIKNVLSWVVKGLLFVVPFIPLYIATNLFFPFITGKAFIFRAIVEVVFALWIILAVFYKEYRPSKNALLFAIGIFVLAVTLATVTGVNPLRSFWSNFERMEGLITYLHLFAYFLVLGNVFKKQDWSALFNLFIVSGLIENFYALSQKLGYLPSPQGGFRTDGTIGNPAYLGAYLIFILGLCLLLFIKENGSQVKTVFKYIYGVASFSLTAYLFYYIQSDAKHSLTLAKILAADPIVGYGLLFFITIFIISLLIDWHPFSQSSFLNKNILRIKTVYGIVLFSLEAYLFYRLRTVGLSLGDWLLVVNPIIGFSFLFLPVAFIASLFDWRKIFGKCFYLFAGLFSLASIYFTASRGPVLGVLLGAFAALIAYLVFKKSENDQIRRTKKIILGTLIGLFVVAAALWGMRNVPFIANNPTLSRLTNLSFSDGTISARFQIWNMSWQGFKEKPILGWGPENYLVVFAKYYDPHMWMQEAWFDRSHNIVLDWLINAGIVGLLSYLSIFFFALRELYKSYKNKKIIFEEFILIIGIFIAYFFQNLFVFDNIATYISFFAILAWIYGISVQEEKSRSENRKAEFDISYFPLIAAVVLAIMFFYSYFLTVKPFLENKDLIQALVYANFPATSLEHYKDAFAQNTFLGRDETRSQLANLALAAAQDQQLAMDKKQEILELAIKEFDTAKEQNPMDPRPYMFEGLIYDGINQPDLAIQNMEAARNISPKKQDILINLAKLYLNQKNYDKAMPILLEAFNEDPAYTQPRITLAGAYILMGDQAKADQLLVDGFQTVEVADNFLVNIYSMVKNYNRLIGIWSAFVKKDPTSINYRKALAGSYLLAGQKENAISVLRDIITIDPSLEKDANDYISQIRAGQI